MALASARQWRCPPATLAHAQEELRAGRLEHAEAIGRALVAADPKDAPALHLLGRAAAQRGDRRDAIARYMDAFTADSSEPEYCLSLGVALIDSGSPAPAAKLLGMALTLHPSVARLHILHGCALLGAKQTDSAIAAFSRALQLEPDSVAAWANLGNALLGEGDTAAALAAIDEALRIDPNDPELWHNRSVALLGLGRWREAESACRICVARVGSHVRSLINLGLALKEQDRGSEAESVLRSAIAIEPHNADAHWNLALLLLCEGRHREGFAEYEWRRQIPSLQMRRYAAPDWDGAPRPGETLLLVAEQGLGDTIQFLRYAEAARQRVGRVLLACPPALRQLLRGCQGVDEVVDGNAPLPPFSLQAPVMSLPHLLGLAPSEISASAGYVHAQPERISAWNKHPALSAGEGLSPKPLRVGIAWQGNPKYRADDRRSIPLAQLAPLGRLEGVTLYSLQKHHGREQLLTLPSDLPPIVDLSPLLDEGSDAFVDTAAVLTQLDLLVCSDSAIAHLAGALGVEVWLLLAHRPDWRWGACAESSAFYPRMRLFRQTQPGNWSELIARVARELALRQSAKASSLGTKESGSHVDHG